MSNTNTQSMYLQTNPLVQLTVDGYASYLSRTNQDVECRELCDIIKSCPKNPNCRAELLAFAGREMEKNRREIAGISKGEMDGRFSMARQMVVLLEFIKP